MRKIVALLLYIVSFLGFSCSFESEGIFTDDTTEEYQLYDYYIDSYGNEGVVAYIHNSKNTGRKYVIVISSDESYHSWGPMGENVYKSDTISKLGINQPSFGVAMHQAMKSIGIKRFPAQAWCDEKNSNEKYPRAGSWRLPSCQELQLVFGTKGEKVDVLNASLTGIGASPINKNNVYWTCVEDFEGYITIKGEQSDYDKENRAVISSPLNSTFSYKDRWLKKNKYYVRAIKYVYYQY
jgi:hypothetical protein